jgi:Tripartite tricarboxylate transporter TctB family
MLFLARLIGGVRGPEDRERISLTDRQAISDPAHDNRKLFRRRPAMAFMGHPKDFFAGLIFIGFGLAAIIIGSNYSLGTAARMGPGYFPRILGIVLLLLGLRAIVAGAQDQGRTSSGMALAADVVIAAAGLLLLILGPNFRKKREEAFVGAET